MRSSTASHVVNIKSEPDVVGAQAPAGLEAFDPRQHHVEDDRGAGELPATQSASSPLSVTSAAIPSSSSPRRSGRDIFG
jgi:hypothetical protein